jgi:hypothetical protein
VKEPSYFLVVRFWVAPGGEAQVMRWLEGGHIQEVAKQPGFLWVKRLKVVEQDATGWSAHAMIYGIETRAHYEQYNGNAALHARFAKEREPFASKLRVDRFSGEVDFRA